MARALFVYSICKKGGSVQYHEQTMLIDGIPEKPTYQSLNIVERKFMEEFYNQFPDDMLITYECWSEDKSYRYSNYRSFLPVSAG